jgi:hypothetical protein
LSKSNEGTAAHIDKHPRVIVDPQQITGRRAAGTSPGSATAQDLDGYGIPRATLRGCVQGRGEKGQKDHEHESIHECASLG